MTFVLGIDFGTLSVRVSVFEAARGRLGAATADIPLTRDPNDLDLATQLHEDHLAALIEVIPLALRNAGVDGNAVNAMAIATTGSTVVPIDRQLQPLGPYYMWCDHRAAAEAEEITAAARSEKLEVVDWCGGVYSSEWGFAKLLHWLRHTPARRGDLFTATEHCDLIVATLCGVTDATRLVRSACAMGHKWMWNAALGGFPADAFLHRVDPRLGDVRPGLGNRVATSDQIAGHLSEEWASRLGLRAGIPLPVGALDAHWDAVGAGIRLGDVVNVVGTSTCVMAMTERAQLVPGVSGVAVGSIHPRLVGVEAGLSACGDVFDAIARRAGTTVAALSAGLERYSIGETGLLRLNWDNGDRTVLINPLLSGMTLGWRLGHTAQDELFAAIEGTACHTRIILERLAEHGVPVARVINAGGIPRRSPVLNQVYANLLGKPIMVPSEDPTSVGSAIFAFLAAGAFRSVEEAQSALCPSFVQVDPEPASAQVSEQLYALYRQWYFALGESMADPATGLPALAAIRNRARH